MRSRLAVLCALALLACSPRGHDDGVFTMAIIGDSNTWPGWPEPDGRPRWAQYLPPRLGARPGDSLQPVVMRGVSKAQDDYAFTACGRPGVDGGDVRARRLLEAGDVDLVIVAVGTNDLRLGTTPAAIVECLKSIAAIAERAGVPYRLATIPPNYDGAFDGSLVHSANALIRKSFPPDDVIDFDTGFGRELYVDAIHLNDAGQRLRAARAAQLLAAGGTDAVAHPGR